MRPSAPLGGLSHAHQHDRALHEHAFHTRARTVLAIDQGTTATTCLVIDATGAVCGRGSRAITGYYPQPGWVEHDANEIFARSVDAARDAIAEARAQGAAMPSCIGITNQRETVVVWDRATGEPVHQAIVWQDRRTAPRCLELAGHSASVAGAASKQGGPSPHVDYTAMIAERTGLVLDSYFSATKLEWLLALPGVRELAERGALLAGTIDSWLVWNLTGGTVHATDHTNASRTMLYDIEAHAWSHELLALFGVPACMLPDIRRSSGSFGTASPAFFGEPIPITAVAGDQQAALFGQGGYAPGALKNTYGTGAFLLLNCGDTRPVARPGILTTIACDAVGDPVYAFEASIFIAGAAVQWLRDGLGIIGEAGETEALAASLASNEGVYFVPALAGLGAPDWEPNARGTIVGLTQGTGRAHLARAALEAMAFATLDVLEQMGASAGRPITRLRVDGGAASNDWLMQFQADVAGVVVERPAIVESTAVGAAGLAGIAGGVWPDVAAFLASRRTTLFRPGEGRPAALLAHKGWRRAVRAALHWARDQG